jgi:7-cyano-7-deazaguanine reductase
MNTNPLGQATAYQPYYDKTLLFPIPRAQGRQDLGPASTTMVGYDIWNCYELSFLTPRGKPQVYICRIVYGATSPCMVESKSLKLYLGSYAMSVFSGPQVVEQQIFEDLTTVLGQAPLTVELLDRAYFTAPLNPSDQLIDHLDVDCVTYQPAPELLHWTEGATVAQGFYSHLFKSNCPITGQPDWATVLVRYTGQRHVDPPSLLRYLVSFREHGGYHENCAETILCQLQSVLRAQQLMVKCFFTRRGGIDINPCRFLGQEPDQDYGAKCWRQ